VGALVDQHLDVVQFGTDALRVHGQDVALHRQVDGLRIHPGQIEVDDELLAPAEGIDRHRGGPRWRAEHLLGEPVEITERIGAHQHRFLPSKCV
jgi:hypothetical protein